MRAARELHGLSLDELSARTKIGLERLQAIENEDVDSLPPLVHLKGFIHAYAAEVGLDPIATTQLYLHRIERHALAEFNSEAAEDVFAEAPRSGEDDGSLTLTLGDPVRGRPTWRLALAAGMTTVIALSVWAMLLLVSNRNEVAQAPLTVTGQERSAVEETPPAAQSSHQASSNPPEAPAAKLTGEWAFTNQIESSRVPVFKGMPLGFRLRLVQDGTAVSGAGVKIAENGRGLTRRQQTPITLQGELEGNRLELMFSERGRRRTSKGALVMHLLDDRSMSGRFSSDAAGSRGTSHALRIVSR